MIKIGIDAMGGDFAPGAVVLGAIEASRLISADSRIVLFGDESVIRTLMDREGADMANVEVVHTTEVIEMSEHPTHAFAKKQNSSIVVGFGHLKEGRIDGFASAGNTGAMMVGCMTSVEQIEGVIRPGISSSIPLMPGGEALLMDVGLNVDCKPEVLYQYGVIGSVYATSALHIPNPRVALLSIGEEKEKGNLQTKTAHELMSGTEEFNFVGNVEAKHIFNGTVADVIICDGFVGNTILKMAESIYDMAKAEGVERSYFGRMNYENIGGTPVLGINSAVVIGHGCSSARAICNMVLQTEKTIRSEVAGKLKETFAKGGLENG